MSNLAFLKTVRDILDMGELDLNKIDAVQALLDAEIYYETLQEIKNKPTTYIFPYEPLLMESIATRPAALQAWLEKFETATIEAETVVVHPVTWSLLKMSGHDMANITIDEYWSYTEK